MPFLGPCKECERLVNLYWDAVRAFAKLQTEVACEAASSEVDDYQRLRERCRKAGEESNSARKTFIEHLRAQFGEPHFLGVRLRAIPPFRAAPSQALVRPESVLSGRQRGRERTYGNPAASKSFQFQGLSNVIYTAAEAALGSVTSRALQLLCLGEAKFHCVPVPKICILQ